MRGNGKLGARLLVGALLATILLRLFFQREYAMLDPNNQHPVWIKKTWWGLKTEERQLRWMKPSGYDYEGWCAKSRRGDWYPFLKEDSGADPY